MEASGLFSSVKLQRSDEEFVITNDITVLTTKLLFYLHFHILLHLSFQFALQSKNKMISKTVSALCYFTTSLFLTKVMSSN